MLKYIAVTATAICGAVGTYYAIKERPTDPEVDRNKFKEQWVHMRKTKSDRFSNMFITNYSHRRVSIYEFDLVKFSERYLTGKSAVGLLTTEGFKLLGEMVGTKHQWSFMPPGSKEIYSIKELPDYLKSVKNNQSSTLFTR